MKNLIYLTQYLFIQLLFFIFKVLGYKISSDLGDILGKIVGPYFRDKNRIIENLRNSKIGIDDNERKKLINNMWGNYGRILSEYPFLKNFRNEKLNKYINLEGKENLEKIIRERKKVVFVSGHFNNFELMAMQLDKSGVKLAAIYRPLNNYFLNKTMEKIREKYICEKQIKKGRPGTREFIKLINAGYSIALMIDQRVSEGIKCKFFGREAFTTTIPAQIVKKFKFDIVPVDIIREKKYYFSMIVHKPIKFEENESVLEITSRLNDILEKMIINKPNQWIWSHNRWKH
ncbi:MAG: lipid A biosynthesis acyltransferase [Candidatus Pelagibacter sp. TMED118]|mgnify:CR=1 FL=1|nr:MAG: lipid A biosynthesis acyltransferase [Candidatus Pelagibacter sp. TMED118]|tara:strand:- start:58 stop:921 length:864 start_codon:yes stop_codon:yes gene_type:complete